MPIPFSQSLRALHADSFKPALIGTIIALVLLSAWCAWFFLARITFYEISYSARLGDNGIVIADFPREKLSRIQRGQAARLYLDAAVANQVGSIAAIVTDVSSPDQTEQGQVKLFTLIDKTLPVHLLDNPSGWVEIEVEYISPAKFVMRASGLFVDTPKVSLSPQNLQGY